MTDAVHLSRAPALARFVLRLRPAGLTAAEAPLGLALPVQACRAVMAGERAALWLGPDEWLLLAPEAEGPALAAALESALAGQPHSLVDVCNRQVGLIVEGAEATAALNAGCPLDLDIAAFPVGMCTRTVFAKCQIVLWRTGPARFHVEAWNSFISYVEDYLKEAAREFSG